MARYLKRLGKSESLGSNMVIQTLSSVYYEDELQSMGNYDINS